MFDYQKLFAPYCREHALPLHLSAVMPVGYQNANGTFDVSSKTVFINAVRLNDTPNHEKAFFLFHELRHASQYLCPSLFSDTIRRSLQYIIQYDGTCYKQVNGSYRKCKLDGSEEYFTNLYLVIYALSDFLIMILSWLVKQSLRAFLFQEVQL